MLSLVSHLPQSRPTLQRLADVLLPGGVDEFVRTRRRAGASWRRIEKDIWTETDGGVDVHATTLRSWYPDLIVIDDLADAEPAPVKRRGKPAA